MRIENQFESKPINLINPNYSHNENLEKIPPKKTRRFLLIVIILSVLLLSGGYIFSKTTANNWTGNANDYDPVTLKPKKIGIVQAVKNFIFNSDNLLDGQKEDRINILLMGMGGYGHDGPYLTDTNIIISIKPDTKEVAMISIPRDLGVKIYDHGIQKINHANSFGEVANPGEGGEYARKLFSETFDIEIPYYVRVDFKAFSELVDTVGGVEIDAPNTFTDTAYPGPNESYQTISFKSGRQNLNGETALQYARSRHGNNGEGSDFARARRQQIIIMALKNKLLSFGTYSNPIKIQKIFDSLSTHVRTNLDFGQIMYLASIGKDIKKENIKNVVLDNSENGYLKTYNSKETGFLLIPKTGNFESINFAIKNVFEKDNNKLAKNNFSNKTNIYPEFTTNTNKKKEVNKTETFFPEAKIEIQNGTWRAGMAGRLGKNLENRGFTISNIGNSYKRPIDTTGVYLLNTDLAEEIQINIKKELGITPTPNIPDWLKDDYDDPETTLNEMGMKYKPNTDILILLGEDYTE